MNIEKAGEKTSHAILILDASGSMNPIKDKTIKSVNEFIQAQKASAIPTYISFYVFHGNEVKTVVDYKPAYMVEEITDKDYSPSGMTNLLDAVGLVIAKTNTNLKSITEIALRPSIIISIVTDGEENYSKEYTYKTIKEQIADCETKDWGFLFLGAGMDAINESAKLGLSAHNTVQYAYNNISAAAATIINSTELLKASRSMGTSVSDIYSNGLVSDKDREAAANGSV